MFSKARENVNLSTIGGNYLGGIVGENKEKKYDNDIFQNCSISEVTFNSKIDYYTGGIVGFVGVPSKTGASIQFIDSSVKNCNFYKTTSFGCRSGGIIGNIESSSQKTILRNIASTGNTFYGSNSAGLINICRGEIRGCNILAADNTYPGGGNSGLLFSWRFSGCNINFAGISIRRNASDDTNKLCGKWDGTSDGSYFAFSDYTNAAAAGISVADSSKSVLGASQTYPYATTSPISEHKVRLSEDASDEYLFGNGVGTVGADGNPNIVAKEIMDEVSTSDNPTRYKYTNASSVDFNFDQNISTFNMNNENDDMKSNNDMPVIRIAGGDTSEIEKYLDIITNRGYSEAKDLNDSQDIDTAHVTAEINVYEWNNEKNTFVRASSAKPSIVVNKTGTNGMSYRATTEYDNGRGRFSLLTVTFKEAGGEYKVNVPVIVRRILEVDYTATLNYGTVFKQSEYSRLGNDAHILESFGNSVTALITYKYNSAYGSSTEYGWDSYLAAGGSMSEAEKYVSFSSALPSGTMLSLVDCLTGKVYTAVHDGSKSIALSKFKDSSGTSYKNKWMSELMEVTATPVTDGRWVKCVSDTDPDAAAKDKDGVKYRLAVESDASEQKYNLNVGRESGKEIQPEESFYLVIKVPLNEQTKNLTANGYVGGDVRCGDVPVSINHTIRPDSTRDIHQNTASTYSFLSGYTHELKDSSSDIHVAGNGYRMIPLQKDGEAGRYINVNVSDAIEFNTSQTYNDKDCLFYKLDINLHQRETSGQETSNYFATGTEGTAKMYVMVGSKYYRYSGGKWVESEVKAAASEIPWAATADNKGELSLVLKDSSGNALDLAGIRKIAKDSGNAKFTVITEMDIHMSDLAFKESIMGSLSSGENEYTKLNYRGVLAVREESLSYSSTSASLTGTVGYYRAEWGSSVITYTANDIKQLGINCSELDTADGNIETTGTYTLDDVVNADEKIESADRIVYSLRLYKRNGTDGSYHQIRDPENYISAGCMQLGDYEIATEDADVHYFSWTDTKTNGVFKTSESAGRRFAINIPIEVNTDNVEKDNHIYANYRLVLTAEMYKGDTRIDYPFNSRVTPGSGDSGSLEDHSDYITYTLTKIATDGLINIDSGTGNN